MKICIVPADVPRKRREILRQAIKSQLDGVAMGRVLVVYGPPSISHEASLDVARCLGVNTSVEGCLANSNETEIMEMIDGYSGARRSLSALVIMAPSGCMVKKIARCGIRSAGGQCERMTASPSGKLVVIDGSGEVSLVRIQ